MEDLDFISMTFVFIYFLTSVETSTKNIYNFQNIWSWRKRLKPKAAVVFRSTNCLEKQITYLKQLTVQLWIISDIWIISDTSIFTAMSSKQQNSFSSI